VGTPPCPTAGAVGPTNNLRVESLILQCLDPESSVGESFGVSHRPINRTGSTTSCFS